MAGVMLRQVHGHQFGTAEYAGHEIVEFVRQPAGELVEGLEFLGLQPPPFRFPAWWLARAGAGGGAPCFPAAIQGGGRDFWFHGGVGNDRARPFWRKPATLSTPQPRIFSREKLKPPGFPPMDRVSQD